MKQKLTVLVVEDFDYMRRVLVKYVQFAHPKMAVLEVAGGAQALE